MFATLDGIIDIAVPSNIPKAVALVNWLFKKGVEKIQEEYLQVIEKIDAAFAFINDDLQDREDQIQTIQYENIGLQCEIRAKDQQIAAWQRRYVDHARDPDKDNIIIIVKKLFVYFLLFD